jgi:hypothetical protein
MSGQMFYKDHDLPWRFHSAAFRVVSPIGRVKQQAKAPQNTIEMKSATSVFGPNLKKWWPTVFVRF